ncbi:MAG: hypothetical protein WD022_02860 [Balneolaceae bacterium]
MKLILLICTIFLSSGSLFAQDEEALFNSRQLGLSYSTLGGIGIHYIHPYDEWNNLKTTGIIIYRKDLENKESYFSLGLDYQRDMFEDETMRAYLSAGMQLDNRFSDIIFFKESYVNELNVFFSTGVGMGIDYGTDISSLVLNGHITYQYTTGIIKTGHKRIGLGAGLGIGFNF